MKIKFYMNLLIVFFSLLLSCTLLAKETNLRIISYNIQGLPAPIMLSHRKIKRMPAELKQFQADVIAFQETFTKAAKLLSEMPEYPYYAYGTLAKKMKLSSGLLIVSKFPIIKKRIINYSRCSGTDCFAQKGVLAVTLKVSNDQEVVVITTHLNAGKNDEVKWSQIEELELFLKKYYQDQTIVLLGDFNISRKDFYYDYITNVFDLNDSHSLYVKHNPKLSDYNRNAFTFSKKGLFGYIIKPKKIDFVWLKNSGDSSLKTLKSQLIMDNKFSKKLSDHFALMVDFSL